GDPCGRSRRGEREGRWTRGLFLQTSRSYAAARRDRPADQGDGPMTTATTLTLGEVTLTRVIEIGRSSFPTTSMLPESTAEAVARHHAWVKPDFWDDTTDDLRSRIGRWGVSTA